MAPARTAHPKPSDRNRSVTGGRAPGLGGYVWSPEIELLERELLAELQLTKLQRQLRRMRGNSTLYGRKLTDAGLGDWEPATLDEAVRLPLTTPDELVAEFEASGDPAAGRLVVEQDELEAILVPASPEPEPTMMIFGFLSQADRTAQVESLTRFFAMLGIRGGDVIHVLSWGQEPLVALYAGGLAGTGTYSAPAAADYVGAHVIGMELAPDDAGRTVATARLLHPRGILASFEHVAAMEDVLARDAIMPSELGYEFVVVREPILAGTHELAGLEGRWGAAALPMLNCAEAAFTALGCGAAEGLHGWDDFFYLELTDDAGRSQPDMAGGCLTVTSLVPGAAPLLRYQTQVVATLDRSPCVCGRTHTRILREA